MNINAEILEQLADSLDELALLVKSQKKIDTNTAIKRFRIIQLKFDNVLAPTKSAQQKSWKEKYEKGYLKKWLFDNSLIAAQATESLRVDRYLNETAVFLANNFQELATFYQRLKYGQSLRKDFCYEPNKRSYKYIKLWCKLLKDNSLIDAVELEKDNIRIDIAEVASATSFINGHWLEILLRAKVTEVLKENAHQIESFDVLSGVQILKEDNHFTEFDLLLMVNNRVYWFECKSGEIGKYYEIFNKHRKMLGLNYEQAIALIPAPNAQIAGNFRKRSQMQTFFASDLKSQLSRILFQS